MNKQIIEIDLDDYEVTYNVFEILHRVISIILMFNQGKIRITFEAVNTLTQEK